MELTPSNKNDKLLYDLYNNRHPQRRVHLVAQKNPTILVIDRQPHLCLALRAKHGVARG